MTTIANKSQDLSPAQHDALDQIEKLMRENFQNAMLVIEDPIDSLTSTKDGVTRTAYHTSCFHLRQDIECLLDEVGRNGEELAGQIFQHKEG